MTISKILLALLPLLVATPSWSTQEKVQPLPIVGWIEKVEIAGAGIILHAKLDTGADHSSLHAKSIEQFEKKKQTWVRFEVRNRYGETKVIEARTHRWAKIKRIMGKSQERIVVRLGLCLGHQFMEVDVNLVDRSNLSFPMLVGRGFLAGNVIVDSSKSYTSEPSCSEKSSKD